VEKRNAWLWLALRSRNDNAANTALGLEFTNTNGGNQVGSTTLYGIQAEQGEYPTSFIPSAGIATTRAADVLKLPLADGSYNIVVETAEGAFVAKGVQVTGGQGWTFDWSVFPQLANSNLRHIRRVRTY
jgi:hypothetical protein